MKESVEDLMERIAVENDFEGQKYSNFIGVAPEVRLTYLYGVWVAELYCEAQICYFEGDKIEEIFPIICKETNWDGDSCFSGATAIEALQKVDIVCRKFREYNFILTADVEREDDLGWHF